MLWDVDHRLLTAWRDADHKPLLLSLVFELVLMLGLRTTTAEATGKTVCAPIATDIEALPDSVALYPDRNARDH